MPQLPRCKCVEPGVPMTRLTCAGRIRYFLCPRCATIRRDIPLSPNKGSATAVSYHELIDDSLPAPIREGAWDLVRVGKYDQDGLLRQ